MEEQIESDDKANFLTTEFFTTLSEIFAPWRCVCTSERFFLCICVDQNTKSIRASSGVNKFNASIKLTLDSSGSKLHSFMSAKGRVVQLSKCC